MIRQISGFLLQPQSSFMLLLCIFCLWIRVNVVHVLCSNWLFCEKNGAINVRTLILSKLDYCSCLLNGLTRKNITRLQRIENGCAKLIFKRPKLTHASPLLHNLHWLSVSQRIKFRALVHVFKCLNNLCPAYLSSLLSTQKSSSYFLCSSKGILCNIPRSHTLTGDRAFSISTPRLWHHLPPSVRNSTNITSFKKALKTHLFSAI